MPNVLSRSIPVTNAWHEIRQPESIVKCNRSSIRHTPNDEYRHEASTVSHVEIEYCFTNTTVAKWYGHQSEDRSADDTGEQSPAVANVVHRCFITNCRHVTDTPAEMLSAASLADNTPQIQPRRKSSLPLITPAVITPEYADCITPDIYATKITTPPPPSGYADTTAAPQQELRYERERPYYYAAR